MHYSVYPSHLYFYTFSLERKQYILPRFWLLKTQLIVGRKMFGCLKKSVLLWQPIRFDNIIIPYAY